MFIQLHHIAIIVSSEAGVDFYSLLRQDYSCFEIIVVDIHRLK